MTHATLSPSKRIRWSRCAGSIREEAKYPQSESGPAAIEGTHSHTLLEHCIKNRVEPQSMVGEVLTDHEGEFKVEDGRALRVTIATDYIKQRTDRSMGLARVISESRVDPLNLTGRTDLSGTVDVQIHDQFDELVELIDYKDGMADAWESALLQMEQYAVGVLAQLEGGFHYKIVRMTVIQPKLALVGGEAIRSVDYPIEKVLGEVVQTIKAQAAATDAPDAPLVPGEKQCKWCPAKGACNALANKALGVVNAGLDLSSAAAQQDPGAMSDDRIVAIMEAAPLMRQLLEGVEKEAQRRLDAGQQIAGLKLVKGKGSRSWSLPEDQIAEKLVKMGVPKASVYKTSLVSPAQAEKLVWKKRDGSEASLTERQIEMMGKEYVAWTTGKSVVALASDSRPAIETNVAPLFSAIEPDVPAWLK
jgi:hypothetical protein